MSGFVAVNQETHGLFPPKYSFSKTLLSLSNSKDSTLLQNKF